MRPVAAGSENAITDRQRRKAERAASRATRLKGRNEKQRERLLAELRAESLPSITRADVLRHPYLGRRFAGKLVVDLAADGQAAVAAHRTLIGASHSSPTVAGARTRGASAAVPTAQSFETANFWDMVIMDIRMPLMQGPAAVRALRTQGFTGVVVGHTGNAVDSDLRHMVESGADACIHKPAVASIIKSHLQAALLRRRSQSAAQPPE
jgi:CheY-like chemotaxis protein